MMLTKKNTSIGLFGICLSNRKKRGKGDSKSSGDDKKGAAAEVHGGNTTTRTITSPAKTEVTAPDTHHVRASDDLEDAFDAAALPDRSITGDEALTVLTSTSLDGCNHLRGGVSSIGSSRRTRSEFGMDDHYSEVDKCFVRAGPSDLSTALTHLVSNLPQQPAAILRAVDSDDDDESLASVEFLLQHICGFTRDDLRRDSEDEEEQQEAETQLLAKKPKNEGGSMISSVMNGIMCG
jgi:hypothetical protein